MKAEFLQKKDEKKWDEFVLNSEKTTHCHLLGWRNVIKKSYGHQDFYLVAKEREKIKGILPAFVLKSFFFGRKIISLPFCNYGGVVGENKQTEKLLLDYLRDYLEKNRFEYFEMRSTQPFLGLPTDLSKFTFVLKLDQGESVIWRKMDKKVRNQVRRANEFSQEMKVGIQYLDEFYKLYQVKMKELGTPVHDVSFFENIVKEFPNRAKIFISFFKNKPIAGLFLFSFKKLVANLWTASDPAYSKMNPNNYLYWETIKYIAKEGFEYFDFGRSQIKSGTFHFKKQWGGETKQLYYQGSPFLEKETASDKKKYGWLIGVWKKLPLGLANSLGPKIRKHIP